MKDFLRQVAEVYVANESPRLVDYCFVTPNKRSGLFLSERLKEAALGADRPFLMPAITTISDLVAELSATVDMSRLELLMLLYASYRAVLARKGRIDEAVDFDRFQYWGDIILSDFNDVDRYEVDARQLFANVKDLREIASNYLTADQLSVIREFWGEDTSVEDVERFWKHIDGCGASAATKSFLKLWHLLYDIYVEFNARLTSMGLSYGGRSYRIAGERLKEMSRDDLPYERYIFVGFNALSTSESTIFATLGRYGKADYYWDVASPALDIRANKGAWAMRNFAKKFSSLYELEMPKLSTYGKIHIEGIPSNIGQTKRAGEILASLPIDAERPNTAVVLPDEGLLIPMLHSLPGDVRNVNITMGFPLRHSPVATLMSNIVTLQTNAKLLHGEMTFYYKHVVEVLSHPLVRSMCGEECREVITEINRKHIYNLSAVTIERQWPELTTIFTPVKNAGDSQEVYAYAEKLVEWLLEGLKRVGGDAVETGFIMRYLEGVKTLRRLAGAYQVTMNENTFFHLLERLMGSETVNFTGEPLRGVQIMGVLETRALDFDNIIMLSMNERIFPRKHYSPTFIPNNLRRGYGMATIDFQESIYAYYFYRLIARAKTTYLLYDTRNAGIKSGEMSRYLYQISHLYPQESVSLIKRSYRALSLESRSVEVAKSPEIMAKINAWRDPKSDRTLSPSAIDHYINCPLQFYLEYVEGFRVENELVDFMDEGTYGTILHDVADHLYESLRRPGDEEVRVTVDSLKSLAANVPLIQREITRAINETYLKLGDADYTPLVGENKLLGVMMERFIQILLRREMEQGEFYFIDGEMSLKGHVKINDNLGVNLKTIIDRVDRLPDGSIRLVDYKTGADNNSVNNWDSVFVTGCRTHQKCFLQLLLYCNAYAQDKHYKGPILPMVYRFRSMAIEPLSPMKIGKTSIVDYRAVNEEYLEGLASKLGELFDEHTPFYPSPDKDACRYCHFLDICDRKK